METPNREDASGRWTVKRLARSGLWLARPDVLTADNFKDMKLFREQRNAMDYAIGNAHSEPSN